MVLAMNAPWPVQAGKLSTQTAPDAPDDSAGITIENARKVFPARHNSKEVVALDNVSVSVARGSIVGVIGRSGAGKSTLIRLVNGLEKPTSGRIVVNGTDITALDEASLRHVRRRIGMIFQHFNLLSSRTVYDNIAVPLEIAGSSKAVIRKEVDPLLDLVGLADKRDRYPAELSGGQKQRVGIARALATSPSILLSDEATSALDPETTEQILALLKKINSNLGLTILFITHEMAVVKALADRVAVIEHGRIVEEGATYDIFSSPRHEATQKFVEAASGGRAPDWLADRLKAERTAGSSAVLYVVVKGAEGQTLLSRLSRRFEIDASILSGRVEMITGQAVGAFTIAVAAPPDLLGGIVQYVRDSGDHVEHLGYVS